MTRSTAHRVAPRRALARVRRCLTSQVQERGPERRHHGTHGDVVPPAPAPSPTVCAIRGAVTVLADEPQLVWAATRALLSAVAERNGLEPDDVISVLFTVTPDLTSAFPARAACQLGWTAVPLLCALEIPVPGALPRCVRVLLHATTTRPRASVAHVYLGEAAALRPDLAAAGAAD